MPANPEHDVRRTGPALRIGRLQGLCVGQLRSMPALRSWTRAHLARDAQGSRCEQTSRSAIPMDWNRTPRRGRRLIIRKPDAMALAVLQHVPLMESRLPHIVIFRPNAGRLV